jgi:hypothetical protein
VKNMPFESYAPAVPNEPYRPDFDSEDDLDLDGIARNCGIRVAMPKNGTVASSRLVEVCKAYTEEIVRAQSSAVLSVWEKARENSDKRRRSLHNNLCVKIFGTDWHLTPHEDRRRISNFAVTVGGRDDFAGQF